MVRSRLTSMLHRALRGALASALLAPVLCGCPTADDDTTSDDDSALPCEDSTGGATIATGSDLVLMGFAVAEAVDRALVVFAQGSIPEATLWASVFDGSAFSPPVQIPEPPGTEMNAGYVTACLAGPQGRPILAFDVHDGVGWTNYVAVGDGGGSFFDPVLVVGESMDVSSYSAVWLSCSSTADRALAVTMPGSGQVWVDAWDGAAMLGPQPIVPGGAVNTGIVYVSNFNAGERALLTYFQDDGAGSYPLVGVPFTDDTLGSPQVLFTDSSFGFDNMVWAVGSPWQDRGLVAFADSTGTYHAVRQMGDSFDGPVALDAPGSVSGRAIAHYFRGVDQAAIVYETSSRDVRVVLDDNNTFSEPTTVGRTTSTGMHDFFIRFHSSLAGAQAFLLFAGDAAGGESISLVPFDGNAFGAPLTVTDSPGFMTAFGAYAASGASALVTFDDLDMAENSMYTYSVSFQGGALGLPQRVDCGQADHGMGDIQVLTSASADRFAVVNGFGGGPEEGTALRLMQEGLPGEGWVYEFPVVAALPASDRFLVVGKIGDYLRWEVR